MNAFSLQMSLVDQGADITPMMKGWMDLSDGKGWPKNEEGWKRYLSRLTESGGFPKIRNKSSSKGGKQNPPPDEFVKWWAHHPESDLNGGPVALVSWNCKIYHTEWEASKLRVA